MNLCILVGYTKKHPKYGVSMSSKKVIWVGFGFSIFFRLLEMTEFIFLQGLLKSIISAWTYVFWLVTQQNAWKLEYQCPQKNLFVSVSGSRIFSTVRNDRIFLFSRALKKYYISLNLCILVSYMKKLLKSGVSMSSRKVF